MSPMFSLSANHTNQAVHWSELQKDPQISLPVKSIQAPEILDPLEYVHEVTVWLGLLVRLLAAEA